MTPARAAVAAFAIFAVAVPAALGQQGQAEEWRGENLQALDPSSSRREVIDVMMGALNGLGLPRRADEGCLHCHVGSMDEPSRTWDWASDAKPAKRKARVMMAMVRDINERYLASLPEGERSRQTVTCYTCHAGRVNPRPLPELLLSEYDEGGLERLAETYRQARARYFAADAYDFRIASLAEVADELMARGDFDGAAGVHELNIEHQADPRAVAGLVQTRLVEALSSGSIESMLERYRELKREHPAEVFGPGLLDGLGWRLTRGGQPEAGLALFELNYAEHPDAFNTHESLGWAYLAAGQPDRGIALAQRWLEQHPDHELGQRLLQDLSERR